MTHVGYVQKSVMSMTEEEQKNLLLTRLESEKQILTEIDKRRLVLYLLPEKLERGSTLYVATLATLGKDIIGICSMVEKFQNKGIELISLKESFSSDKESDYFKYLKVFRQLEIDGSFCKKMSSPTNKIKEITPEIENIMRDYDRGLIGQVEATRMLGISTTLFYRFKKELELKRAAWKLEDLERAASSQEIQDLLNEAKQ